MIAVQALAGCGMPDNSSLAYDEPSAPRTAEYVAREARLRRQIEKGTFGLAQLFPGGMPVDARHLPPLPPPSAVPMPVVLPVTLTGVARPNPSETPMQVAFAVTRGRSNACVYKPIMSDADIDACR